MASLRALARKGRVVNLPGRSHDLSALVKSAASDLDCIAVSTSSVAETIIDVGEDGETWAIRKELRAYPSLPMTPPFPRLWLEFSAPGCFGKQAVIVERSRDPLRSVRGIILPNQCIRECQDYWTVKFISIVEMDGDVHPCLFTEYLWLGEDGRPNAYTATAESDLNIVAGEIPSSILSLHARGCLVAAETLCRLNCKNVRLESAAEATIRPREKKRVIPSSVWREIVVSEAPQRMRCASIPDPDPEPVEFRWHWVRGHYADYSKGKGLFGNPKLKAVFWIPEYRVGDESLGQVIPEYIVQ